MLRCEGGISDKINNKSRINQQANAQLRRLNSTKDAVVNLGGLLLQKGFSFFFFLFTEIKYIYRKNNSILLFYVLAGITHGVVVSFALTPDGNEKRENKSHNTFHETREALLRKQQRPTRNEVFFS